MALIHGSSGSITIATDANLTAAIACISSFTVDATVDSLEASCMGSTTKSYLAGTKGWTATVECNAQDTGYSIASIGGTGLVFTFDPDDGDTIELVGTGIITGISGTTDVNGVGTVSYTVQGTGALTENPA